MKTILVLLITGLLLVMIGLFLILPKHSILGGVAVTIGVLTIGAGVQKYLAKPKGFWQ